MKSALIIVDMQEDFMPGGPLGVKGARELPYIINQLMDGYDLVVVTKDWHPADHVSFAANHPGNKPGDVVNLNGLDQILWPTHCVQNTPGAELVKDLNADRIDKIIHKGVDADIDSYSGFYDNGRRRGTGLGDYLKEQEIKHVGVCGVATEYCVKATAIDAVKLGFETMLWTATRGVELQEGGIARAWEEMRSAGVQPER